MLKKIFNLIYNQKYKVDLVNTILITLIIILFFLPVLIKNDFGGDFVAYFLPHLHNILLSLKDGYLPLWFPYSYNGLPGLFKSELAFFHPITQVIIFINLLFNVNDSISFTGNIIEIVWVFYLIFGSVGFYIFARKIINFTPIVSLIIAIVYALNPFTLQALNTIVFFGIVILPWILKSLIDLITNLNYINFLKLTFFNIILFSGGYPYFYVYFIISQITLALIINFKKSLFILMVIIFSAMMSSFFLLPGVYIYTQSNRSTINYEDNSMASFAPTKIINVVNPLPFDNMYSSLDRYGLFTSNFISWGTVTLLPLLVGLISLKYNKINIWLLGVFFIFLFYSFGPYFHSNKFLGGFIPLLYTLRSHFWGLTLTMFSGSIFIGYGIKELSNKIKYNNFKNIFWFFTLLVLTFLLLFPFLVDLLQDQYSTQLQSLSRFLILILFSLVIFEVYSNSKNFSFLYIFLIILIFEYYFYFNNMDSYFLKTTYEKYFSQNSLIPDNSKDELYRLKFENNQFAYNTSHIGLYSFVGYETVPYKSWYDMNSKYGSIESMNISNVKYLVTTNKEYKNDSNFTFLKDTGPLEKPWETFISSTPNLPYWTPESTNVHYIYVNNNYLPRYFVPEEVIFCKGNNCKDEYKLPKIATVKSNIDYKFFNPRPELVRIENLIYTSNKIVFKIYSPDDVFLVGSDTWDKGWEASVNGSKTKIYLVDRNFRGFMLKGGTNILEMQYKPPFLKIGILITLLTTLIFFVFLDLFTVKKIQFFKTFGFNLKKVE